MLWVLHSYFGKKCTYQPNITAEWKLDIAEYLCLGLWYQKQTIQIKKKEKTQLCRNYERILTFSLNKNVFCGWATAKRLRLYWRTTPQSCMVYWRPTPQSCMASGYFEEINMNFEDLISKIISVCLVDSCETFAKTNPFFPVANR